ncbi:MAG TPA: amino acid ABC transporter substrate-binding protein [Alphaproteobacteria bacterium]
MFQAWRRRLIIGLSAILIAATLPGVPLAPVSRAWAADPVKVGFSMNITGGGAAVGKQILAGIELWRDDVNARGGLLRRPIQLVYYDDQSNPANVPGIYAKLLDVDKVDLLVGPYATNFVAPVIPALMQRGLTTVAILANAANSEFHYDRYFVMSPNGPDPKKSYSTGFFELAAAQSPKPKTVALLGLDAEYGKNAVDGARENAQAMGFEVVYDRSYPPTTTDFAPVMRAVKATNPDLVYAAAYPPDTVGIVRAANEVGLDVKMFGGAFVGLLATPIKTQLGPLMNGIVGYIPYLPAKSLIFPGTQELLTRYQAVAATQGIDPLGYTFPPIGYAACEVLAQAVAETKSLDHGKLAQYMHKASFKTVIGEMSFGPDGEWTKPGEMFYQFQHVSGNGLDQFKGDATQPLLWPAKLKTGELIYPYAAAKK